MNLMNIIFLIFFYLWKVGALENFDLKYLEVLYVVCDFATFTKKLSK